MSESKFESIVDEMINELETSTVTKVEFSLAAGLGGISKQLKAFNGMLEIAEKIDNALIKKGLVPGDCGDKVKTE